MCVGVNQNTYWLTTPPLGIPAFIRALVIKAVVQVGVVKVVSYHAMCFRVKARYQRPVIWKCNWLEWISIKIVRVCVYIILTGKEGVMYSALTPLSANIVSNVYQHCVCVCVLFCITHFAQYRRDMKLEILIYSAVQRDKDDCGCKDVCAIVEGRWLLI